tara:strand:+ start:76 stop:1152 length:1077 start_codon:yes stop_codon:yes gene_type:complete
MKKYTILLILCLYFSYVKAQTILVNSNVISVQEDVTFPFWLDSMSTIEIGTQVVSISALEFNIVPVTNGHSLVFSQTKTITSQETVPNGMTWKITAVLLDSTAINNSSSNGGGQVIVSGGGNMPVALSQQSSSSMNMGDAMLYCDSLQEDGYDNWVIPTIEEIMFVAGGGGEVPGTRTTDYLLSSTSLYAILYNSTHLHSYTIRLSDGNKSTSTSGFIRCVRHESISVSGSGSSSGSSLTPSTLGSGMPTMISNESANALEFSDAMLYCDNLNEAGYSDWVMPTIDQLTYAISGGCVIPDNRNDNYIWTRTAIVQGGGDVTVLYVSILPQVGGNSGAHFGLWYGGIVPSPILKNRCVR